ncbi:glycosyltransferase, partial [Pelagophyceae sp. CCMP2097]
TIFVSVAAYRDPECAKTIARAYAKAAAPERIFFGIYQQNDDSKDVDCVLGMDRLVSCPSHAACGRATRVPHQVRVIKVLWMRTLGPTVARHLSERLYRGETYAMSFDSHTDFARGWDAIAIDMFKRVGEPRAIFTTYPASYSAGPHSELWADVDAARPCDACRGFDDQATEAVDAEPAWQHAICRTHRFVVGRTVSFKHDVNPMRRPTNSTRVAFLAAGFNFASGRRILDRPSYDAHSAFLFDGKETSLAVRTWTHGYDFYHPDRDIVSHLYIPNKSPLR